MHEISKWEELATSGVPDVLPAPSFSSDFSAFSGVSAQRRCFLVVKVHENNGASSSAKGKLDIVLSDLRGSLRYTAVWPPLGEVAEVWEKGSVIMIFGARARCEWNQWSVPSDACVQMDAETPCCKFPDQVRFEEWAAPEAN